MGQLSHIQAGDHICLVYETPEEQLAAAVPFIKEELARGERCVYITEECTAAEIASAFTAAGLDVPGAVAAGALVLAT
jgi:chemotaxis family two-component system sensor kinase Cph1